MTKKLTPKQEKFVQNIVNGMSQREAYKKSYNAKKMKNESIDTKAWELMQKVEIKERYEELLQKLEDKAIMSAKDRMIFLTEVVQGKQKQNVMSNGYLLKNQAADLNTKMKAIDILNRMSGDYVTKVEADVNADINITIE